jgi:ankyrin repeat protein
LLIQSWLKIIGGSALCAISMHSAAQLQAEPQVEKPVKAAASSRASSQMAKTTAKQDVVYAPASEVTRKFINEARQGNFDSATFLLKQGADINCQVCLRNNGETLLMQAASSRRTGNGDLNPLLSFLINNGANAKLNDAAGNTMLHYVFVPDLGWGLLWPHIRSNLRFILDLGMDPKAKNNNGDTALHSFALNAKLLAKSGAGDVADYASLIAELVRAGAKLDEQNIAGRTPLMMSMRQCSLPIVRAYLHAGAATNIKDAAGQGLPEIARANAIQSPTKECIEIANFFSHPQNIESLSVGSIPAEAALNSKPLSATSGGTFPTALVADFQGVIKSSLQAQPVSAKGKIDENGRFEYAGDNGVVMAGSFDASGPQLEGNGITRLPSVGGRPLTYPNGENEARVALIAKFDGQVLRGSYKSKFESGTFSLCPRAVVSAECTATADPLGALFKGLGGLLSGR